MKLRNKKTGAIIIPTDYTFATYYDGIRYGHHIYYSLAELNEDWEDYEPKEPIIKDEKIRKAVRAWSEANGIDRVWHECETSWLRGNGLEIYFDELELEQGNYTIIELCGDEDQ